MHLLLQPPANLLVLAIELVDNDEISDLHDSLFGTLKTIATSWRHNVYHKIDDMIDFNLRLTHTNSLDNDRIEPCMLT